jgi:2'-5' RNA ligase
VPDNGTADATTETIGVAIAVPEPYGSDLRARRKAYGDAAADAIPTHVTLLGPTLVDPAHLPAISDHLSGVARATPGFPMHLRGTGTFRPVSEVVFVQVALGIAACERLESAVRSGPLAAITKFTYHPHVTVAHDIDPDRLDHAFDDLADYDATFDVTSFGMYAHGADGVWRLRETFELAGEGQARDGQERPAGGS